MSLDSNIIKKSKDGIRKFADSKKENIIVNIENASSFYIVLKWVFTNKISILFFLLSSFFAVRSYYLEYEYLKERNKTLILEKEEILSKTKELKNSLDRLKKQEVKNKKENKDVRKEAKELDSNQKKDKILEQIDILKKIRGIK